MTDHFAGDPRTNRERMLAGDLYIADDPESGRLAQRAVRLADAVNAIEGAPVSADAKRLSESWAKGEITGQQMKALLLASHKKMAQAEGNHPV